MKAITYSLQTTKNNSYYKEAQLLAEKTLCYLLDQLHPITSLYRDKKPSLTRKHDEESCLELLLLGAYARRFFNASTNSLEICYIDKLIDSFSRTNDYLFLLKRLQIWRDLLQPLSTKKQDQFLHLINETVFWFEQQAIETLGAYTANVDNYLKTNKHLLAKRLDRSFCESTRLEYHINMVGAEIINNLNRSEFLSTEKKIVVLPGCMREKPQNCLATDDQLGKKCQQCSTRCHINYISHLGVKNDFKVNFVSHQSSFASAIDDLREVQHYGVVGVACVPSLIEGGYMLGDHSISAQCVVLDYCGCTNHWHNTGVATTINTKRLLEILDLS